MCRRWLHLVIINSWWFWRCQSVRWNRNHLWQSRPPLMWLMTMMMMMNNDLVCPHKLTNSPITGQTTLVGSRAISSNRGSSQPLLSSFTSLSSLSPFSSSSSPGVHSICESRKVRAGALALAAPSSLARIKPTRSADRMIRTWWTRWWCWWS